MKLLTLTRTLWCCIALTAIVAAGSLFAGPEPISSSGKNPVMEQRVMETECSWTGFYLGGNAGYGWSDNSTWSDDGGFDETPPRLTIHNDADGFIAGGQIGFNWQINHFVIGLEGSGGWLDLDDTHNPTGNSGPFDNLSRIDYNWYGAITPRFGFAWNHILFYVKGGVDFVDVKNRASDFIDINTIDPGDDSIHDDTEVSWTAGGGLEYCINPHWSVKVEYDFLNVDDTTSGNRDGDTFHHDHDGIHMVTAGINFRFGAF
jgi:outer membrane immunogenic protein